MECELRPEPFHMLCWSRMSPNASCMFFPCFGRVRNPPFSSMYLAVIVPRPNGRSREVVEVCLTPGRVWKQREDNVCSNPSIKTFFRAT